MFFGYIIFLLVAGIGIAFGILSIFRAPFMEDYEKMEEDKKNLKQAKLERLLTIIENRGVEIDMLLMQVKELKARKRIPSIRI